MIKKIILVLTAFGFLYSIFISIYGGFYIGIVLALITIGFASTTYMLDKKINYKIIFYIWIAIIVVAVVTLFLNWIFNLAILLKF